MTKTSTPQMVPHSRESEEAVIGSVMMNPSALDLDVSFLVPEDFYIYRNRWIWEAYLRLHSQGMPIDLVTVSEELDRMGKLSDIGGSAYLVKMTNNVPSSLHAEAYGMRVRETAVRRKMLDNANQEAKDAYDEDKDVNTSIVDAQSRLNKLVIVQDTSRSILDIAVDTIDDVSIRHDMQERGEKVEIGYQTGIGYIDRNIKGLKKGWFVVVSGKPKVGKSRLVAQISKALANQDPGIYINLEMDEESMIYRMVSMDMGIPATDIEFGLVDPASYIRAIENFPPNMELWCTVRPTVEEIRRVIAQKVYEKNLGWAVIDYIDLMSPSGSGRNEVEEDKELWNDIKSTICKDLNVMVLGIESVNKLAADGIMTDDKVVGSYGKIHAVDLAFGYSPYHAIPYKGLPELDDADRERRCRVLNVMADRHRECTGIVMGLEMGEDQLIDDLKKTSKKKEGVWMGPQ